MVLLLLCELILVFVVVSDQDPKVLYDKDGVYEHIRIMDDQWDRPARFLYQDRSYSAAMYLDSDELVYDYTKYYELYKLINPGATKALVLGGGAYSLDLPL